MAEILRYVLVDRNDQESDYEFESYDEAVRACDGDHAVVERHYTFSDSELVYTPDGGGVWPPKGRQKDDHDDASEKMERRHDRLEGGGWEDA